MHNSHVEMKDRNSNMWYTLKVFAHTSLTNAMQWDMTAGHVSVSQVRNDRASQTRNILHVCFHIYLCELWFFFFFLHTKGAAAKSQLQNCLNAETQDDEKLYEITLFSECVVIPFLQESYRLKYLSKMACSEANRWSFETQRGHETSISTTLPTSHTISMHTFCQQIGR